jgi:hypothetical protein
MGDFAKSRNLLLCFLKLIRVSLVEEPAVLAEMSGKAGF